jgi:cob(I)alamin adenosyltransferase
MVALTKIYTRTGDEGLTSLGTGARVPKTAPRIAAYGTVDETNAFIGLARQYLSGADSAIDAMLARIQNDLFDLGADLCMPLHGSQSADEPLRIIDAQVLRLEAEIDQMNSELKPLTSFVLPGGSLAAATLHVARTVCRRAEREMAGLAAQEPGSIGSPALKYVNRLSDFLFVASRYINDHGAADVLWQPGLTRPMPRP